MEKVTKKPAASGRVRYSDPVVLHETARSRILVVPFFIPHTAHDELAVKIATYRKADPPESWRPVEEKTVSFKEPAARRLLEALRTHLAVAPAANGTYLLVPIDTGLPDFRGTDPAQVASALVRALSQPGLAEHLQGLDLGFELAEALKGAIRVAEMRSAVARLRELLDGKEADEQVYQQWCQDHSWAFGNAYVMQDSVREISPGDHLDLLLPVVFSGYRDIVELKRPDKEVLLEDRAHRNYYFSADVSRALGQCHRYLDVLQEEAGKGLRDHPEIVAYHPRATVVIGRSANWPGEKLRALHGLNRRLNGLAVMTYDQLLMQGERIIGMVGASAAHGIDTDSSRTREVTDDDDIPF